MLRWQRLALSVRAWGSPVRPRRSENGTFGSSKGHVMRATTEGCVAASLVARQGTQLGVSRYPYMPGLFECLRDARIESSPFA